jgi:hypothetical protein
MLVSRKHFQPGLMFTGKVRSPQYNDGPVKLYLGRPQPYTQTLDLAGKAHQVQTL